MRKHVLFLIGLILLVVCSCHRSNHQFGTAAQDFVEKSRVAVTNELYQEKSVEASKAMLEMHKENRLPGIDTGEHGTMTSDYYDMIESDQVVKVVYPLSQIFRFVKTGETSTNNYLFERLSKGTSWQLKRAWETDSNGQTIKEWPIQ